MTRVFWLLLIVATGLMLVEPLAAIPRHAERDFNEGSNALKARRLAEGEPLYPPAGSLRPNIYPPLSYLLLSRFSDPLLAGRILALAGLLGTALLLGAIVQRGGGDGKWTAAIVVAYMAGHHNSYVAMNDPQWSAHALMCAGLACLFAPTRWPRSGAVVGAALMVVAGLVKHSILPLPVATAGWLWMRHRPRFWPWLVSAVATSLIAAIIMLACVGPTTLLSNLDASRLYSGNEVWHAWWVWLVPEIPFVIAAVGLWRFRGNHPAAELFALWAVIAVPWGLALRGGLGADRNHLFDANLALCALSGVLVGGCPSRWRPWVLLGLMSTTLVTVPGRVAEWGTAARAEALAAPDIAWLAAAPGPLFAERPALLYWAGRDTAAEPFDMSMRIALGRLPPERLINADIATLQLARADGLALLSVAENRRWLARYRLVRTSPAGFFYERKAAP